MKNVLVIGLGENYGGVEKFIFSLWKLLNREKISFDFLVYYDIPIETENEIILNGGKVYKIARYSKEPLRFLKEIFCFYSMHKEYKLVHCHASHASVIMYAMPIWFNNSRKIIFHSHNADGNNKLVHYFMRIIVNIIVDKKIACSQIAAKWMFGLCKNVEIIYNAIECEQFRFNIDTREAYRKKYNLENKFVVGNIGRFDEQKNHNKVIDIFEQIYLKNKNAHLILIGQGKKEQAIRDEIKKRGLINAISIFAFQENIKVFYQIFDAFLLPSLYEGFPIVGIEAQIAGLPVFVSNRITKELSITNNIYYLALETKSSKWANLILEKSNINRYIEQVMPQYELENLVKKIERIYLSL